MSRYIPPAFAVAVLVIVAGDAVANPAADAYDQSRSGQKFAGRIVVPTNQVLSPRGRLVEFAGRPTDVALSPDGRILGVLNRNTVMAISIENAEVVSEVRHANGSWTGICFSPSGDKLYASSFRGVIGVFDVAEGGKLTAAEEIKLDEQVDGKKTAPAGLAIAPDGGRLWIALNLRDSIAEIDLASGKLLREVAVGSAPYGIALSGDRLVVTNWGGRRPSESDLTGPSGAGTPVRVDSRTHVASEGSVSLVGVSTGSVEKEFLVGLHPSGVATSPDGRHAVVANANSDTISVIDLGALEIVETLAVALGEKSLFGSAPNALAFEPAGKRLYVANGTNNAVAVVAFRPGESRVEGFLPVAWYPAGIVYDARRDVLCVANVKGVGSRNLDWRGSRKVADKAVSGFNSHDYQGAVSLAPAPRDEADLRAATDEVLANNRYTHQVSALAPARKSVAPRPVPERHGEPSVFKHVLYVIKENRTYDQVFGDVPRGEGDPDLCIFGRCVTPNHHKLVDEFVLLDNFYCSGTLSADGHQWTDEAYVTDYVEKAFGGWPRSYPYWGGDAMAYSPKGFLWDNALAHKRTLRVYGEFVKASVAWRDKGREGRPGFLDCYRDYVGKTNLIDIQATAAIDSLKPYICPTAIGFPSIVPDVHRAQQFIDELAKFEKSGDLPNLMVMLLPNDHTSGTAHGMPTPEAAVADNDLALARVVEALSRSRFWKETCVFVVQDDPQAGFDHIDGRRTVAMVLSPYSRRRGAVVSTNYNQTSMVRTIELILGIPPMNQLDASATAMADCFVDAPDLTPYEAAPNVVPLDELNPAPAAISNPSRREWALASAMLPLDEVDQADEDTLNRILWNATRGDEPYPAWAVNDE
ncbi:MAG: alkaline phosphatase family protein [Lacipirellulaceae bacterium]